MYTPHHGHANDGPTPARFSLSPGADRAAQGGAGEDDAAEDDAAEDDGIEGIEGSKAAASGSDDDFHRPTPHGDPKPKRRAEKAYPRLLLVEHKGRVINYDDENYAPPFVAYMDGDVLVDEETDEILGIFEPHPPGKAGDRGGRMVATLVTRALEPDLVLFAIALGPTPGKVENALLTKCLRHAARRLAKKRKIKVTIALLDFDPE